MREEGAPQLRCSGAWLLPTRATCRQVRQRALIEPSPPGGSIIFRFAILSTGLFDLL